jgi:hypothetical protein
MIFGVQFASILLAAAIVLAGGIVPDRHRHRADTDTSIENVEPLPAVTINDNRRAAGVLDKNTLTLELRAGVGLWRPEGDAGPALRIEAFGERGAPLTVPSPLVRVPEGTEVVATIHNNLESLMRVFGFCERGTAAAITTGRPRPGCR